MPKDQGDSGRPNLTLIQGAEKSTKEEEPVPVRRVMITYTWQRRSNFCMRSVIVEFPEDTLIDESALLAAQELILKSDIAKKLGIRRNSFSIVGFSIFEA